MKSSVPSGRGGTPRAVVDACALIPSLIDSDNLCNAIVEARVLVPVFCPEMLDEAQRTLGVMLKRRPNLTDEQRNAMWRTLELVQQFGISVSSPPPTFAVRELGPHQKDAHLFWTCEQGDAQIIITIEPRLWYDLREWRGIPIRKPTDALRYLGLDG